MCNCIGCFQSVHKEKYNNSRKSNDVNPIQAVKNRNDWWIGNSSNKSLYDIKIKSVQVWVILKLLC